MKIVSMVPSWTETLIAAGADVIGRTRFCIHPEEKVKAVRAVGGTKDIKWNLVSELNPDLLVLDREENPKSMHDEAICETLVSHVASFADVETETQKIADRLMRAGDLEAGEKLAEIAERWGRVSKHQRAVPVSWSEFPGVIEWLKLPTSAPEKSQIVYVIWKDPWMAAGPTTFIGSMLAAFGFSSSQVWTLNSDKYPKFTFEDLPAGAVLLLSSEPYPFLKRRKDLVLADHPAAFVDGESFSWFGLRSLRFLEQHLR